MSPLVLFRVLGVGTWSFLWKRHTDIFNMTELDIMRQMVYNVSMTKKRYFHEVIEEEEKILAIGLKQSRLSKKERLEKEKTPSEELQDELEPIND